MPTSPARRPCRPRLAVEQLETRDLPSVSVFVSVLGLGRPHGHHPHAHHGLAGVSVNVHVAVGPFVGIQISI